MTKQEVLIDQILVREDGAGYAPEKMKLEFDAIEAEEECRNQY